MLSAFVIFAKRKAELRSYLVALVSAIFSEENHYSIMVSPPFSPKINFALQLYIMTCPDDSVVVKMFMYC